MSFRFNTINRTANSALVPLAQVVMRCVTASGRIPSHTRFVQSYAKKFCSEEYISPFLLYLPFTLLLAPMALTACEKIFIGCVENI